MSRSYTKSGTMTVGSEGSGTSQRVPARGAGCRRFPPWRGNLVATGLGGLGNPLRGPLPRPAARAATLKDVAAPLHGLVHGNTVVLDEAVPPLEGKRVLVVLEPVEEPTLTREQNLEVWRQWVAHGPQGPIEDEGEPEFPSIARGDIRWFRFASPDKRRPVLVLGRSDLPPSLSQVPSSPEPCLEPQPICGGPHKLSLRTRGCPERVAGAGPPFRPRERSILPSKNNVSAFGRVQSASIAWRRGLSRSKREAWSARSTKIVPLGTALVQHRLTPR